MEASSIGDAAKKLLTAAAWAHDHAQLLVAACPQLTDAEQDPVLHVITENAREARGLLDTGMRVHLVSKVVIEGKPGWAVSDLN